MCQNTLRQKLQDKNGRKYDNVPSVNLEFYRNGEENGEYIFQSMTATNGKPVLFSFRDSDAKEYEDAVVLCIKDASDKLHLKIIRY